MHDTDVFARMPALDSLAGQPPIEEMLCLFEQQCEVAFKAEIFLVRDNGAVFRRARPQARRRKLDEVWTFGTLDKDKGYLVIGSQVIHQIVASAFHGPRPSTDYVVDHIDTNRQNNRSDNLRWVTRLENILLNPITCARIQLAYGSLETFFENPGASSVPNLEWMRVVTKEQAQESRRRLLEWAAKGQPGRNGTLGDWIYKTTSRRVPITIKGSAAAVEAPVAPDILDTPSLTAGASQRNWRTPTEFPECPNVLSGDVHLLLGCQSRAGADRRRLRLPAEQRQRPPDSLDQAHPFGRPIAGMDDQRVAVAHCFNCCFGDHRQAPANNRGCHIWRAAGSSDGRPSR